MNAVNVIGRIGLDYLRARIVLLIAAAVFALAVSVWAEVMDALLPGSQPGLSHPSTGGEDETIEAAGEVFSY